jgi:hypothetical protein
MLLHYVEGSDFDKRQLKSKVCLLLDYGRLTFEDAYICRYVSTFVMNPLSPLQKDLETSVYVWRHAMITNIFNKLER